MEGVSPEVEARVGSTLETDDGQRVSLEQVLGEGGFGAVYRAEGPAGPAAVKVLHAHLAAHGETVVRFQREALAATTIGSEHIVRVDATGTADDGAPFLVMELLEGRSLRQVLEAEGPFTLGRACRVAMGVCDGLIAAHGEGIVHRDLKLDNVFLLGEGGEERVKLLDFGVSKFLGEVDGESLMTRTGTALGTPYYMSPEQAQGKKDVDARSDLYSLGVVLFKLLTDQHPFADPSFPMLVMKICTEPAPPVTEYRADVPAAFDPILWRLLAKAKEGRFKSAKKVKEALAPFTDADEPPQLNETAPVTEDKPAAALAATVASAGSEAPPTVDAHTGEPVRSDLADEAEALEETLEQRSPGRLKSALAILGGLVVLVLLLVSFGGREDPEEELPEPTPAAPLRVPLPRPQPPVPVPLLTPEPNALGWRWVNPMPRALPTFHDVDVAGGENAVMVGQGGAAARIEAGSLTRWDTGTTNALHGVAFIGPAQAIAVGDGGTLRALLMRGPERIDSRTDEDLRDVVPTGTLDAFVVGDGGTLLELRNLVALPWPTGREENLFAAAIRGRTLFAVGQGGVVLAVDTDTREVRVEREGGAILRGVGGCARGDLYAAGDGGTLYRRTSGGRWRRVPLETRESLGRIGCHQRRAVIAGRDGGAFVVSGDRYVRLESGSSRGFLSAAGSGDRGGESWLVGEGGNLARVADDRLQLLTVGHTGTLAAGATLGGVPFLVGRWGAVLRLGAGRFEVHESSTDAGLAGLAALGDGRLLAVGDADTLLLVRYDGAELLDAPPGPAASWKDVVAGGGLVFAVGSDGATLRGPPEALGRSRVDGVGTLRAVAGTPARAVAVGDAGAIVRFGMTGAVAPERCGSADLLDVHWEGVGPAIAVGAGGTIVRLEGLEDALRCTEERPAAGVTLRAVGPGWDRGRLLAVGDDGLMLARDDAGTWTRVDLDASGFDLYGMARTDRDVLVFGAGGVVLRHVQVR